MKDKLDDISFSSREREKRDYGKMIETLHSYDKNILNKETRLTYDVMDLYLTNLYKAHNNDLYFYPLYRNFSLKIKK